MLITKSDLASLFEITENLKDLEISHVICGGILNHLYFYKEPPVDVDEFRRTRDFDFIVSMLNGEKFSVIEEKLRSANFTHDTSENAPFCRYWFNNTIVDMMPIDSSNWGFNNNWLEASLKNIKTLEIEEYTFSVLSYSCFLATKMEAFKDRGRNDFYGFNSHDIEDIILFFRCVDLEEVKTDMDTIKSIDVDLFNYVTTELTSYLNQEEFRERIASETNDDDSIVKKIQEAIMIV